MVRTLKHNLDVVLGELKAAVTGQEASWLRAYVACCHDQIVGVAVVR